MNIVQIEENVKQLIHKISKGELHRKEFIYELLLAYGHRSQSIGRVRNGERNLAEDKENTVFWKRQIYFKITKQHDLHGLIDQMKNEKRTESNKIRFLIVTDFKTLLAIDTKTQDTLDVPFGDLAKKFDFFLPWAGMEKAVYQGENPADVKAAEKLAKLFDEIKADNFNEDDLNNKENLHHLNIFLSRLLFCYFAEDTEIFKDKQFTSAISKSNEDGSDLSSLISRLFKVLNQSREDRETDLPDYLADFPYVNGGLFKDDIQVPKFTRKSRRILIECGAELDWSDINPDIFGSMFQAVVHTEQRSTMGQHYTSVPNIMKVIEPLFLNDLYEELEKNQDSVNKLLKLQQRLGQLKIFDPACGSGNFLIIAYKELRKFEMEVLKRIQELELEKTGQFSKPFSLIQVSQFYGIELDDFAHEVAILSLWLAEHQMNLAFKDEFGESQPTLPLRNSGKILNENAITTSWLDILSYKDSDIIFIVGNPPYLGSHLQNEHQKSDLRSVKDTLGRIDYISAWFYKAAELISKSEEISCAFVSTNSISQGEQVSILWSELFKFNTTIKFAHQSFKWENNAKSNASVIVVIIGLENKSKKSKKFIFNENVSKKVSSISPYLIEGPETYVEKQTKPLCNVPELVRGNEAIDDGNYLLDNEEKEKLLFSNPSLKKYIKKTVGAFEFLNGKTQWCLWFDGAELVDLLKIPELAQRIDAVREFRLKSKKEATREKAKTPHLYSSIRHVESELILVPRVSSENRDYIPFGFLSSDYIIKDSSYAIYNANSVIFAFISSRMHMVWTKAFAGRLKTDMRYSSNLIYNTFPFLDLNEKQILKVTNSTFNILSIREKYSSWTLSQLYSNKTMPDDLRLAHLENDILIEKLYIGNKSFNTDEERLEFLFNLYENNLKGKAK